MVEELKRKVPGGIKIFSWLIIIFSGICFLDWLFNFGGRREWMLIPPYLYLPMLFVSVIVALNLLHLKKWSRVAIIILSLLFAAESVINIPTMYHKIDSFVKMKFGNDASTREKMEEVRQKFMKERDLTEFPLSTERILVLTRNILRMVFYLILLLPGLISLVFNVSVVCYFARPTIRGHFK